MADARALKALDRQVVRVRFPSWALKEKLMSKGFWKNEWMGLSREWRRDKWSLVFGGLFWVVIVGILIKACS
jgi:hypothetical protein